MIRIVGPERPIDEPPEISQWLALVAAPEAQGLCVFLRVDIRERRRPAPGPPDSRHELVVVGLATASGVTAKAVWPEGNLRRTSDVNRHAAWEGEEPFLAALDVYLATHAAYVSRPPAPSTPHAAIPAPPAADAAAEASYARFQAGGEPAFWPNREAWAGHWITRLLVESVEDAGPRGFATRLAVASAPPATFLLSAALAGPTSAADWLRLLAVVAAALPVLIVWHKAVKVATCKSAFSAAISRGLTAPASFRAVTLGEVGAAGDVNARKWTDELVAAGCVWSRDFTANRELIDAVSRFFVHPELPAEVLLNLMSSSGEFIDFPAHPTLLVTTRFADGSRLTTLSGGAGTIYRKNRNRSLVVRLLPNGDPDSVLALHRSALNRLIAEGRVPTQPEPDRIFETLLEDRTQAAAAVRGRPVYTWDDALYQAFGVVRREYLE
jgi:hypothetical protein